MPFFISQKKNYYKLIIFYCKKHVNRFVTYFRIHTAVSPYFINFMFQFQHILYATVPQFHFIFARWLGEMDQRHNSNNNNKKHTERNSRILSKNFQTLFFLHFKRLAPAWIKKKRIFFTSLFHPNGFWKSWWSLNIYSEVFDTIYIYFFFSFYMKEKFYLQMALNDRMCHDMWKFILNMKKGKRKPQEINNFLWSTFCHEIINDCL